MSENFESLPNNETMGDSGSNWESLSNLPNFNTFRQEQSQTQTETKEQERNHEKKLGVEIMELSPDDNPEQVAEALYLVDQYIFPDLFDNEEKAKVLAKELFTDDPDALFSYKKTLVAKNDNGDVVGIAVYRDSKCTPWDTEAVRQRFLSTGLELPAEFDRANEKYMKKVYDKSMNLKIVGVVTAKEGVSSMALNPGVAYTSDLVDYIIDESSKTDIVKKQKDAIETLDALTPAQAEEIKD